MWYRIKNCHMLALLIPGCRPCGHKAKQTWTDAVRNMKYSGIKVVSMPIHFPVVVESKNQTTLSSGTIPWPALYQSAVWRQCKAPEMFKLGAAAGNTLTMSTPHNSTSSDPFSSFKRRYWESGNEWRKENWDRSFWHDVTDLNSMCCSASSPNQLSRETSVSVLSYTGPVLGWYR